MKKNLPTVNAWINLRQLLDDVNQDTDFKGTDERSQRLLEWIVDHHNPEQPLFVQTIVMQSQVASPASIHKYLDLLERNDLIRVDVDPDDSRRRIVSPTERTRRLMDQLSLRVRNWASGL